jgi:hypothetical protein
MERHVERELLRFTRQYERKKLDKPSPKKPEVTTDERNNEPERDQPRRSDG